MISIHITKLEQILLNTLKVFICLPSPKIELTIFVILMQQNFFICTLYVQETFKKLKPIIVIRQLSAIATHNDVTKMTRLRRFFKILYSIRSFQPKILFLTLFKCDHG